MADSDKSRDQLLAELRALRRRVESLEGSPRKSQPSDVPARKSGDLTRREILRAGWTAPIVLALGVHSDAFAGTPAPTTSEPTTMAPTTMAPTTAEPTTMVPTTMAPTTMAPTTAEPTTMAPTTMAPTTMAPTTMAPTTMAPTTPVRTPVPIVPLLDPQR